MTASNAAIHHPEEAPARESLPAPESNAVPAAAHPEAEALVPPEKPLQHPIPPQAAVPTEHANPAVPANDLEVTEELLAKAAEPLGPYLGNRINGFLTDGLMLSLHEYANHDKAGLELRFTGPKLVANSALLGEQVIHALKDHPEFAALYANPETVPHAKKSHEGDKTNTMSVYIQHLSVEQFQTIIKNLATPAHEAALADAKPTTGADLQEVVHAETASQPAAHGAACACASCATAAAPEHADAGHAEHADAAPAADAAPTNIVASPVAEQQLLKAANTNLGVVK